MGAVKHGRGPLGEGYVTRAAFARVLEQLVAEAGSQESLARELETATGRALAYWSRSLSRIRSGKVQDRADRGGRKRIQYRVSVQVVDQILTALHVQHLWYGPELRRWGAWRVGGPGTTQPRSRRPRPDARMSPAQVLEAHRLYAEGLSLRALGALLWEQYGYASADSCSKCLSERFLREGLATRNKVEVTRLRNMTAGGVTTDEKRAEPGGELRYRMHRKRVRMARGEYRGHRCEAVTMAGHPCRSYALAGGAYCHVHEPSRRAEVLERIHRTRTYLPNGGLT